MNTCPYCSAVLLQADKTRNMPCLYACLNCMNACVGRRNGQEVNCEVIESFMDIRYLTDKGSNEQFLLSHITVALDDLPTLPAIPQRVMRMVYDPLTSLSEIAQVINEDPIIAVKILKLANSAFYGGRQKITSLELACSRLGIKMVVKVVQAIGSKDLYHTRSPELRNTMRDLWQHAVVTAYCAGEIAALMPILSNEDIFLAGLIHDIGKVVLLNILFSKVDNTTRNTHTPRFTQLDSESLSQRFHALAGLHAVQAWDLSTELRVPTFFHHLPNYAPLEEWKTLSHIVALANAMANSLGFGKTNGEELDFTSHPSVEFLKLDPIRVAQIHSDMQEQIGSILESLAE